MNRYVIGLIAVAAIAGGYAWLSLGSGETGRQSTAAVAGEPIVSVKVPELSANARIGERVFNSKCAACHGQNAAGVEGAGPPFIHPVYRPAHHGDMAFMIAPRNGVRSHHWNFGNMPPVEGITDGEIKMIIAYVRELQRANGIR